MNSANLNFKQWFQSQGKQVFEGIIDEVYAKHDWTIIA